MYDPDSGCELYTQTAQWTLKHILTLPLSMANKCTRSQFKLSYQDLYQGYRLSH